MTDNYPVGAANDPLAPYNQEEPQKLDVRVRETLVKEDSIASRGAHTVMVWDYDETLGRDVCTECYDDGCLAEDYHDQRRTASECLRDCVKVLRELVQRQYVFLGGVTLKDLLLDCQDWEQESVDINEHRWP